MFVEIYYKDKTELINLSKVARINYEVNDRGSNLTIYADGDYYLYKWDCPEVAVEKYNAIVSVIRATEKEFDSF